MATKIQSYLTLAIVTVVDYGMGNIHSVCGAFEFLGAKTRVTADPIQIYKADIIVLPGVGSFREAMERLNSTDMSQALKEAVLVKGKKLLGICLGQQLLAEHGREDGGHEGLALISGKVDRIAKSAQLKVPHVGFSTVLLKSGSTLGKGLGDTADFYFVHSFCLSVGVRPGIYKIC